MRKQTKIAALVSAAALLAIGASMTSFAAWDQTSAGEWIYLDSDGDRVYGEWQKSGENWYYLDESTGVMVTDRLIEYNSEWYYVNADGVRVADAWKDFTASDDIYLSFDQAFEEGTVEPSVVWYRFGSNGKALRAGDKDLGEVVKEIDGKYYVFNEEGQMLSGWIEDQIADSDGKYKSSNYYYLGDETEGWATTGWKKITATKQASDGSPTDSTTETWFHFGNKGVMDIGGDAPKCVSIDGAYYYFDARGAMCTDDPENLIKIATPPTASGMIARVDANGAAIINGWYEADEDSDGTPEWYYMISKPIKDSSGKTIATLRGVPFGEDSTYNSDTIYMGKQINGKAYLFRTSDGQMVTGKVNLEYGESLVYEKNTAGRPTTFVFGLNNTTNTTGTFVFNTGSGSVNGELMTGKFEVDTDGDDVKETYYSDKTGKIYTSVLVNGSLYDESGVCYKADDGNTYMLVDITGKDYMVGTGTKAYALGLKSNGEDPVDYSKVGHKYVVVSSSGKVKQSATKLKVGDDYVKIENYIVTDWAE